MLSDFRKKVTTSITIIPFEEFINLYPGNTILKSYLNQKLLIKLQQYADSLGSLNSKSPPKHIEYMYACNFLNLPHQDKIYIDNKSFFDQFITRRLESIEYFKPEIRKGLSRFDLLPN